VREDLPVVKPTEVITALEKADFGLRRQTGGHAITYKPGIHHPVSLYLITLKPYQKELSEL
jgi:predicted RNA binding protein YcfA (HicA-like mRNA interferase family)